jgi:hypothetical protein
VYVAIPMFFASYPEYGIWILSSFITMTLSRYPVFTLQHFKMGRTEPYSSSNEQNSIDFQSRHDHSRTIIDVTEQTSQKMARSEFAAHTLELRRRCICMIRILWLTTAMTTERFDPLYSALNGISSTRAAASICNNDSSRVPSSRCFEEQERID